MATSADPASVANATVFVVVSGCWDGGIVDTSVYMTREGALARTEWLRNNGSSNHEWTPMPPCANEDGYEQVGWELRKDLYVYFGERIVHD